jgi:integrase
MQNARYLDDSKLVIFTRGTIFQARTRLPDGRYVWRSLRTTDPGEALKKGWKVHHQLEERCAQGIPVSTKTFGSLIDDYVAWRTKDCERGKTKPAMLRQVRRVSELWKQYAGAKALPNVGDEQLKDYVEWRRDYYTNHFVNKGRSLPQNAKLYPTDSTLQWEIMLGKAIIKWAHDKGLRGNKPLPRFSFTPKKKRARPAFELYEYRILWRTLWKRVHTCRNKNWRASRELLRDYVLILANSGLRVGEANSLKIRDLIPFTDEVGRESYRLVVSGKTGERDVIPRASAAKFIKRVLLRRQAAGAGPDDLLFAMRSGRCILTLADQFDAVLNEAGIRKNSKGDKYTLYSLRHFYAVMALRKNIGVFAVARNMGTSVEMIQQYYGKQATAATFATTLGD